MELVMKKSGVKMRWNFRRNEDEEHHPAYDQEDRRNEARDVFDSVDYVKGMRTSNMKWNKRLLIPKPINYKDFEVKWRNWELLCMEEDENMKKTTL